MINDKEKKQTIDDKVIKKTIKMIIKEYDQERKEENKKQIYHNTYILMKKYNTLKYHTEKMSDELDLEYEMDDLGMEAIWILSIAKSKVKSIKMISYIDSALEIVEDSFRKKGAINEFVAFKMYFLENKNNEQIMKKLACGKNSPKKWSDNVLHELSVLLWGYEALGI